MALPAPNLDDRRFQELVDEAKRYVMRRCPEWTDHNVSDPGVTLIETFAYMTDLLLYRLNRVPDRLYLKFLEMIGLRLFPPTPARTKVTFWLSSEAVSPLTVAAGTRAATLRSESEESIEFATVDNLDIVPCALDAVMTQAVDSDREDHTEPLRLQQSFNAFSTPPVVGDALVLSLSDAVPRNAIRLQFRCSVEGVGVDPDDPPLRWEAWDGSEWTTCEVDHDSTGGLNTDGEVVLHVPEDHRPAVLDARRGGWIRALLVEAAEGQPTYSAPPIIHAMAAATIGGTVDAIHAEIIENEALGESEGVPGQRFLLGRSPVLAGSGAPVIAVSSEEGWQDWTAVDHFAGSGPNDRHYLVDFGTGEVLFGPAVRDADGGLRHYGAVPPRGSVVAARSYAVGGGRRGCVAKGGLQTLKSSIPFVSAVENRAPAIGGVDAEDIESAKTRGPILLRTRGRAVTAEDYEQIALEAAPSLARIRCLAATSTAEAGGVRILVVPSAPTERGRIRFEDLVPPTDVLETITEALDRCRVIGTRVVIEPPLYQGVTVVAQLRATPRANAARIEQEALERLETYFNPLIGGADGEGWPWGRPVQSGDAFAVLQGINGVDLVEDVRVFGANPVTGERGAATQRLVLEPGSLVFSYAHQVLVETS